MSNYATIQLLDQLARLKGVGDVFTFGGQDYSMRVWLDPNELASRNLSAGDVVSVLREQNVQVAAGQIGQAPVPKGQNFQYTMSTLGRLTEPEQFGEYHSRDRRERQSHLSQRRRADGARREESGPTAHARYKPVRWPGDLSTSRLQRTWIRPT